jgi:hypothetical protein
VVFGGGRIMLRPTGLRGLRVGRQGQRGYQAQLGFRQRSAGSERGLVVFQSQYSSSDSGSVDSGGDLNDFCSCNTKLRASGTDIEKLRILLCLAGT